jgi:nucleotide-binding universal stress UspA family protein
MFKTIILNVEGSSEDDNLFRLASRLAQAHGGHLILLFVEPEAHMPTAIHGRGASAAYVAEMTEAVHRREEELEQRFRAAHAKEAYPWEWRQARGEPLTVFVRAALAADMVIIGEGATARFEDVGREDLAEHLIVRAGAALLFVPAGCAFHDFRRPLIAWNGSGAAGRALRDSLPLLARAERGVLWAMLDGLEAPADVAEVVAFLGRHGIEVEQQIQKDAGGGTGQAILRAAEKFACDFIVMGAYGHSRLREIFLGGATRYALRHSKLPLFLSH